MTLQELKEAVFVEHHKCGICDSPVGYLVINDTACFDSNCDCTAYKSSPRPIDAEELAAIPSKPQSVNK